MTIYKKSITAAARLGLKWARPLPLNEKPNMAIHVDSYRELADYAAKRNIRMLVENFSWMESDPESVPKLVKDVDRSLARYGQLERQYRSLQRPRGSLSVGGLVRLQSPQAGTKGRARTVRHQSLFQHRLENRFSWPLVPGAQKL